jgi:hypothetical protein
MPRVIAVAPAINLSGQRGVDPLLQADLVFKQLGQVKGVTAVPVNRVAETYLALGILQVESRQQAEIVCDALGVDALIVPTVTMYDPYDPPKMGASLALFVRNPGQASGSDLDVRELTRRATPGPMELLPRSADFIQAADVMDASSGSVRDRIERYAAGRTDPFGPLGVREVTLSMDSYAGFVWHELIDELIEQMPRK